MHPCLQSRLSQKISIKYYNFTKLSVFWLNLCFCLTIERLVIHYGLVTNFEFVIVRIRFIHNLSRGVRDIIRCRFNLKLV